MCRRCSSIKNTFLAAELAKVLKGLSVTDTTRALEEIFRKADAVVRKALNEKSSS